MTTTELLVSKTDLAVTRVRQTTAAPLQSGQVRARVDRFALTSNNITYAAFGDAMHYWDFFPVQGDDAQGWGSVPVWGLARWSNRPAPRCRWASACTAIGRWRATPC